MTIKEIEEQTGMSRANVRFYESEGLLTLRRKENGYRIYEQSHVELLLRIKLLRALDLPLEDIRAMQQGNLSLEEALLRHREVMEQKEQQLIRSKLVLESLLTEKRSFDTLQPEAYLLKLETEGSLRQDVPKHFNLPWRRYFARAFDFYLYQTLLRCLFPALESNEALWRLLTLLVMLVTEPLLLWLFKTTAGKAIFCIKVTSLTGDRLLYPDALERTWIALLEGCALNIPLITIYFEYKSFDLAQHGKTLSWERESELTIGDDAMWRYALYVGAHLCLAAVNIWIWCVRGWPFG